VVIERTSPCDYKINIMRINTIFHINMLMQYFERVESDSAPRNELPKVGCVILEYDESHYDDNHKNVCITRSTVAIICRM